MYEFIVGHENGARAAHHAFGFPSIWQAGVTSSVATG